VTRASTPTRAAGVARTLRARRAGIDTYQQPVVYMRVDSDVCRAEGFEAQAQVELVTGGTAVPAILHRVDAEWLELDEVALSEAAWCLAGIRSGDPVSVRHAVPLDSLRFLRAKVYGRKLDYASLRSLMTDVAAGRVSDLHLASFVTACAGGRLDHEETVALTRAMLDVGERMTWAVSPVMDKHCVGGLPGNRTTLIVVPIVAACGVVMPKTSSRAITSPAGTADTMETLAPVDLDLAAIRRVVEKEGACIAWGSSARLSPADDVLIRVERPLDLDSEAQLVASVLSKKLAVGAERVLVDIPVGPSAKVRSRAAADSLALSLTSVGEALGLAVRVVQTDGRQPVGRGIGPALEAMDVLAVLERHADAPADLRERALMLAGAVLELAGRAPEGAGLAMAARTLDSGAALAKLDAIRAAQGGLRVPRLAAHRHPVLAPRGGRVGDIDNRRLARAAKLAGAPQDAAAGALVHVRLGDAVEAGQPLFTIHAETPGELDYALAYLSSQPPVVGIDHA
jgi:thymidine phosphorylase